MIWKPGFRWIDSPLKEEQKFTFLQETLAVARLQPSDRYFRPLAAPLILKEARELFSAFLMSLLVIIIIVGQRPMDSPHSDGAERLRELGKNHSKRAGITAFNNSLYCRSDNRRPEAVDSRHSAGAE